MLGFFKFDFDGVLHNLVDSPGCSALKLTG